MSILGDINEKQREAVTATEGFVRIIAGAGSGKTKALTHRYAYLVKAAGIHPGNVLCVTFTNKAAGEMKRRVRQLAGDGTDTSLITTYHGFCVRVLREEISHLFWPERFRILDESDQKKILEEIYTELGLKLDYASFEKIIALIDQKKASTDYVDSLLSRRQSDYDAGANPDEKIVNRYMLRQKKIFGLDFNDLINFVFVLFERFQDICAAWQKRLVYIQVDEFQDSSKREMKLIDILSRENRNLFVVGDPDQNIYEWRGAEVGILVDFDITHPGTKTILLEQNYRSTGKILAAANELISRNENRVRKTLFTKGEGGSDVIHLHCKSEDEESGAIVNQIRRLTSEEGFRLRDIALLYRSGFLSQFLEKALSAEGIPYEMYGSMRFFERMEIVDAISYLKLVESDDDAALMRIVNKPRRGFGRAKANRLLDLAKSDKSSLLAALMKYAGRPELSCPKAGDAAKLIYDLREKKDTTPVSEILQRLLVESGYEQYIRESGNMERFDNLSEFKKITLDSEREYGKTVLHDNLPGEFMPLSVYLDQLSRASEENLEDSVDRVKLMTIHAAKGLEFPVCFIVGMTDGVFPSSRTIEDRKQAGLEEERRLCFVALTRAMKRLYLTDSEGTGQNGRKKLPSRFFNDIGEHNFKRIGTVSKEVAEQMKHTAENISTAAPKLLAVGEKIHHAVFGSGEIIGYDGKRSVYDVKFESGVNRPISADYDFNMWRGLLDNNSAEQPKIPDTSSFADAEGAKTCTSLTDNAAAAESAKHEKDDCPAVEYNDACFIPNRQAEVIEPAGRTDLTDTIFAEFKPDKTQKYLSGTNTAEKEPFQNRPEIFDDKTEKQFEGIPEIEISLPDTPEALVGQTNETQISRISDGTGISTGSKSSANLWKDPSVPKTGWVCTGVTDLGKPSGICSMCGYQIIRYVHHMRHPLYPLKLGAGCICAGRMEGNVEGAKKRENEFKSLQSRRQTFISHARKLSKNGNEYFKYKGELVTIIQDKFRRGQYKAVWRGIFTQPCPTPEEALSEAFDFICGGK